MSFLENSVFAQKMYAISNVLTNAYDHIYDLNKFKRKKAIPSIYQSFVPIAMSKFNKMYHNNLTKLKINTDADLVIKEKSFFTSTVSNGEYSFIANMILIDTVDTKPVEYFYGYNTCKKFMDPPIPYIKDISDMTQSTNQQMEIIVCTTSMLKALLTYHGYYYNCWKILFPKSNNAEYMSSIYETIIKLSFSAFRYNYYKCLDKETDNGLEDLYYCDGMLASVIRNIINIIEDDFEYFSPFITTFPDFASQEAKYIGENLLDYANTTQVQE